MRLPERQTPRKYVKRLRRRSKPWKMNNEPCYAGRGWLEAWTNFKHLIPDLFIRWLQPKENKRPAGKHFWSSGVQFSPALQEQRHLKQSLFFSVKLKGAERKGHRTQLYHMPNWTQERFMNICSSNKTMGLLWLIDCPLFASTLCCMDILSTAPEKALCQS